MSFVIAFAIVSTALQLFVPYRRYASILKWLTLSLFAYVAVLLVVHTDWPAALARPGLADRISAAMRS